MKRPVRGRAPPPATGFWVSTLPPGAVGSPGCESRDDHEAITRHYLLSSRRTGAALMSSAPNPFLGPLWASVPNPETAHILQMAAMLGRDSNQNVRCVLRSRWNVPKAAGLSGSGVSSSDFVLYSSGRNFHREHDLVPDQFHVFISFFIGGVVFFEEPRGTSAH